MDVNSSIYVPKSWVNYCGIYAYDMGASCFRTGNFDATTMYFGANCIDG